MFGFCRSRGLNSAGSWSVPLHACLYSTPSYGSLRPDVATVVSRACSHGAAPTRAHRRAATRILHYLVSTCELGLRFPVSTQDPSVSAYVDVAFTYEPGRKSRYGYAVFLGSYLVSWASKCTTMVCLSTAEAEFVAATEAAKDVVWLRGLLLEYTQHKWVF